MIISVDGIDGVGKTSVCKIVNEKLGIKVISSSNRTEMLPEVRKLLNKDIQKFILLRFLYFSSVNQLVTNELKTKPNEDVILDRYYYSTIAYHIAYDKYYNNGANINTITKIYIASEKSLVKPDINIFLQVNEKERLKRLHRRNNKQNNKLDFESKILSLVRTEFNIILQESYKKRVQIHEIKTDGLNLNDVAGKVIDIIESYKIKSLKRIKLTN